MLFYRKFKKRTTIFIEKKNRIYLAKKFICKRNEKLQTTMSFNGLILIVIYFYIRSRFLVNSAESEVVVGFPTGPRNEGMREEHTG